jgi:hypothetical protein
MVTSVVCYVLIGSIFGWNLTNIAFGVCIVVLIVSLVTEGSGFSDCVVGFVTINKRTYTPHTKSWNGAISSVLLNILNHRITSLYFLNFESNVAFLESGVSFLICSSQLFLFHKILGPIPACPCCWYADGISDSLNACCLASLRKINTSTVMHTWHYFEMFI